MPNTTLSDAIKEAMASSPADVVILHTLEIRHPSFLDDNKNPYALRVVRDNKDLSATLEKNAPIDPGKEVIFKAYSFDINLPILDNKSTPYAKLAIDNISLEITQALDSALTSQNVISVTYRPYLSTDTSSPHYDPPLTLIMTDIIANSHTIKASLHFPRLAEMPFPNNFYTSDQFPGLLQ